MTVKGARGSRYYYEKCNYGTYKSKRGGGSCWPCPAGSYADTTGCTQCKPCPIGSATFQASEDENQPRSASWFRYCKPCAKGTSAPFVGMARCIRQSTQRADGRRTAVCIVERCSAAHSCA